MLLPTHFELIKKYHVRLKKFLQQGISNPEFYGDFVYECKKIIGNPNSSDLFKQIVNRLKKYGNIYIMRQTACLVLNSIMVEGYASLFCCTPVAQCSDSIMSALSYRAAPLAFHIII